MKELEEMRIKQQIRQDSAVKAEESKRNANFNSTKSTGAKPQEARSKEEKEARLEEAKKTKRKEEEAEEEQRKKNRWKGRERTK